MELSVDFNRFVDDNDRLINLTLDLCNKHGLSWSVEREKLISPSGRETTSFGLFRSDNGAHLSTMSGRYVPCDNFELAKMLVFASQSISDLNVEDTNGGSFKNGQKVYFQIPLPNAEIGHANVTRNLTALNSHDGTTGVALGTTQTVVSCQNSFYTAYRGAEMKRVGHNSNMYDRLKELVLQIEQTIANDQKNIETFKRMTEIVPTYAAVDAMKELVFALPTEEDDKEISTRKSNLLKKFDRCLEIEFSEQGGTMWGLFNAVTRYKSRNEGFPRK